MLSKRTAIVGGEEQVGSYDIADSDEPGAAGGR
jgi:hypothetical protein